MKFHLSISRIHALIRYLAPALLMTALLAVPSYAEPKPADLMQGIPPAPELRVTKANWPQGPYNRWALQHIRELMATKLIPRGDGSVQPLPANPKAIVDIPLATIDGGTGTITDWLNASYTDGFLVLHKGEVLTEVYMNNMTKTSYHNFFSMSKSFTGSLAGILAERGQLDENALISSYVPELKDSAYGDATVRQLMDMTIGINYTEDYADLSSDVYLYAASSNASPNPEGLALYDVLPTYEKQGEHGQKFHYVTANTDALGWVLQRASNRHLAELLTTEIWSKLGAEYDAYAISDLNGTPWLGGGLNTTLRDAARFGLMMVQGGVINGNRVVPESFVEDIQTNAISTGIPGNAYRNQWWVYPAMNAFAARGVSGQQILVVPELELVVVKLSSWPALGGYDPKGWAYDQRALMAIVDYFSGP